MLRSTIGLLAVLSTSACFSADTRGAPCTEDEHCGVGFSCAVAPGAFAGRCGVAPACPDLPLPTTQAAFANTAYHGRKAACVGCADGSGLGADAPDVAFSFEAERSGTHIFRTLGEGEHPGHAGSSFPTVLYVLDGPTCMAEEVAFGVNGRDESGSNESIAAAYVARGDTVTVVVDGEDARVGSFGLIAETLAGSCPDRVVAGTSHLEQGEATDFGNTSLSSCGATRSEDYNVAFTATEPGLYLFEAVADADAVVAVHDGAECDAPGRRELACSPSAVTLPLDIDQTVVATVDGLRDEGPGAFSLAIDRCAITLADEDLASYGGETATVGIAGSMAPSCRPPDATNEPAVAGHFFTARVSGVHTFVVNAPVDEDEDGDSAAPLPPARIAIRDGARCEGPELSCTNLLTSREEAPRLVMEAGDRVVIVVETLGGPASYVLEIEEPT